MVACASSSSKVSGTSDSSWVLLSASRIQNYIWQLFLNLSRQEFSSFYFYPELSPMLFSSRHCLPKPSLLSFFFSAAFLAHALVFSGSRNYYELPPKSNVTLINAQRIFPFDAHRTTVFHGQTQGSLPPRLQAE